ncbi:MAG: Hsp20/alpha crystallin family protein [Verrucomicrobiota bacterium]|jgi:HSP20 family protein
MNLTRYQRPDLGWAGFGRPSSLRDELDRLFEPPWADLARTSQLLSGWIPALDVHEDKDNFVVQAELPGMKREEIDVTLHDGVLSISGERKAEKKYEEAEVCRTERFFGKFQRTVTLSAPVAADKVKAQYKDGVLIITLPNTEAAKPKQIDENVN